LSRLGSTNPVSRAICASCTKPASSRCILFHLQRRLGQLRRFHGTTALGLPERVCCACRSDTRPTLRRICESFPARC
jgi:hypothetical protein